MAGLYEDHVGPGSDDHGGRGHVFSGPALASVQSPGAVIVSAQNDVSAPKTLRKWRSCRSNGSLKAHLDSILVEFQLWIVHRSLKSFEKRVRATLPPLQVTLGGVLNALRLRSSRPQRSECQIDRGQGEQPFPGHHHSNFLYSLKQYQYSTHVSV